MLTQSIDGSHILTGLVLGLRALFVSLASYNGARYGYRFILLAQDINFSLGFLMSQSPSGSSIKQPKQAEDLSSKLTQQLGAQVQLISLLPVSLRFVPRLCVSISVLLSIVFMMPTAQAASCKLPKSYYKNVSCTASRGYFLAIKDFGAPVALLDSSGKKVIDLSRYQKVDADNIAGGLLPVLRNSHVGYVNMQGREVVPAVYDMLNSGSQGWARPVSDGRIVVKRGGNYGVISSGNKTIVPFSGTISSIDDYRSGVARVSKNKAISWLDKNGNPTANPNGSASSNKRSDSAQAATNTASKSMPATAGKQQPSAGFTTLQPHQQDGRWGFVDEKNVTMITYSFDEVRPFSEGLAGVRVDSNWGFLNLGGELVVAFRFDSGGVSAGDSYKGASAFVFKDGKAWVGNLKDGSKICVDKEGTNVSCD